MNPTAEREGMPQAQRRALKRGQWLSWLTIIYLLIDTVLLFILKGNSQALQAAWIQDLLSFLPPVAFLVGVWVAGRPASKRFPYGYHQSMNIAHFVAAVALLAFGGFLLYESAMTLFAREYPAIGLMTLFGVDFWQGWIMIAFMFAGVFPPLILGRLKLEPARKLHNKVLYTDSKMNKADWLASAASIIGIMCVGFGIWWADAVAAIIISIDILLDGIRNLRSALSSMIDSAPETLEDEDPHPLPSAVNHHLLSLPWVKATGCRVREESQIFHVEAFVVTEELDGNLVDAIDKARDGCLALDWKIQDVVIMPVHELSPVLRTDTDAHDASEAHSPIAKRS